MVLNLCLVGPTAQLLANILFLMSLGLQGKASIIFISWKLNLRFLSCLAFSIYEVVRVACLSCTWFAHAPFLLGCIKQSYTNYATNKPCKRLRKCQPCKRKTSACRVDFSSLLGKREVVKSCISVQETGVQLN